MRESSLGTPPSKGPLEDRLSWWKEIATLLKRDVTTVQRWEKREGMPLPLRVHDKIGSACAFRVELDSSMHSRNLQAETVNEDVGLLPA